MTLPTRFNSNPFLQFSTWYQDALKAKIGRPDAMVLATANLRAQPSARVVLFKGLSPEGILFFTNYQSKKGQELAKNPNAALVFYWPDLGRQIRIEGKVKLLSGDDSDLYWNTRPRESRLSALASNQSRPIASREILESKLKQLRIQNKGKEPSRPDHWGGYCLMPKSFEFWIEGKNRFHDRFLYSKKRQKWTFSRLAP